MSLKHRERFGWLQKFLPSLCWNVSETGVIHVVENIFRTMEMKTTGKTQDKHESLKLSQENNRLIRETKARPELYKCDETRGETRFHFIEQKESNFNP